MTRVALTICFCLIDLVLLQAQTISRFPINTKAKWKISDVSFSPDASYQEFNEQYEYFIESDTLINSQKYYKLYKSGVAYYDTPFYYERVYSGAIRDEDNKFYMVKKNQATEILLVDYNLELGDTIISEIGKGHIINNIDTLEDGRKIISSLPEFCGGCCTTITLLEGIGHSGGIMEDPPCEHIGFYGHYMNCFEEDGVLIYENEMSIVDCDNFFTSVNKPGEIAKINIYPVPVSGILTIELLDYPINEAIIEIYDVEGILLSKRIDNQQDVNRIHFDVSTFKKGLYIIRISDNKSYIIRQFVVE